MTTVAHQISIATLNIELPIRRMFNCINPVHSFVRDLNFSMYCTMFWQNYLITLRTYVNLKSPGSLANIIHFRYMYTYARTYMHYYTSASSINLTLLNYIYKVHCMKYAKYTCLSYYFMNQIHMCSCSNQ